MCNLVPVDFGNMCRLCYFGVPGDARPAAAPDAASGEAEQRRADVDAAVARRKKRVRTFLVWPPRDPAGGPRQSETGPADDYFISD
jgi:hypothetical protein